MESLSRFLVSGLADRQWWIIEVQYGLQVAQSQGRLDRLLAHRWCFLSDRQGWATVCCCVRVLLGTRSVLDHGDRGSNRQGTWCSLQSELPGEQSTPCSGNQPDDVSPRLLTSNRIASRVSRTPGGIVWSSWLCIPGFPRLCSDHRKAQLYIQRNWEACFSQHAVTLAPPGTHYKPLCTTLLIPDGCPDGGLGYKLISAIPLN